MRQGRQAMMDVAAGLVKVPLLSSAIELFFLGIAVACQESAFKHSGSSRARNYRAKSPCVNCDVSPGVFRNRIMHSLPRPRRRKPAPARSSSAMHGARATAKRCTRNRLLLPPGATFNRAPRDPPRFAAKTGIG